MKRIISYILIIVLCFNLIFIYPSNVKQAKAFTGVGETFIISLVLSMVGYVVTENFSLGELRKEFGENLKDDLIEKWDTIKFLDSRFQDAKYRNLYYDTIKSAVQARENKEMTEEEFYNFIESLKNNKNAEYVDKYVNETLEKYLKKEYNDNPYISLTKSNIIGFKKNIEDTKQHTYVLPRATDLARFEKDYMSKYGSRVQRIKDDLYSIYNGVSPLYIFYYYYNSSNLSASFVTVDNANDIEVRFVHSEYSNNRTELRLCLFVRNFKSYIYNTGWDLSNVDNSNWVEYARVSRQHILNVKYDDFLKGFDINTYILNDMLINLTSGYTSYFSNQSFIVKSDGIAKFNDFEFVISPYVGPVVPVDRLQDIKLNDNLKKVVERDKSVENVKINEDIFTDDKISIKLDELDKTVQDFLIDDKTGEKINTDIAIDLPIDKPVDNTGIGENVGVIKGLLEKIKDGIGNVIDGVKDIPIAIDKAIDKVVAKEDTKVDSLKLTTSIWQVFPFCIPFDIINFVSALNAPPVTPVFKFPLKIDNKLLKIDYELTIDFSSFDSLALIFRSGMFISFGISLILLSRKVIGD